ncbi:MAG: PEP-CTERM system TPR-repeat protein PrsT [Gammaproteobacteria bacterium]|nr:PEP-CTERM system TPR-repeat protein PrsT [Gammaproteobacteria bacterium]
MFANHWYYRMVLIIGLLVPGAVLSAVATAQDYLEDALTLFDKGEYNAALIQLKNVLLLEPDNAGAYLLLGKAHLERGDAASAEREISRARDLDLDAAEWMAPLGRAWLLLGRNDELLKELTPEERFPDTVRADILQLQGQAHLAKRQFREADDKFFAVLVLQPGNPEALLGRARIAYHRQEREKASELIEEALQRDPRNADAWMMKGGLLSGAGDQKGAISAYRRALDIDPEMSAARAGKTAAHIALGEYAPALAEIAAIRGRYPDNYMAHYLEALVHFRKQDMNRALTSIHNALGAAPRHLPSQLLAGSIYYRKGQYRQAEEYLRKYWNARPGEIQATRLLAVSLVKTGQAEDAITVLEKGVEIEPDDAQMLAILGSLYTRTGQANKGLDYLERATAAAPDSGAILTELAIGHLATGDAGQAVTELQGAVELGDEFIQADTLLVLMHLKRGNTGDALRSAEHFVSNHPDNAVARNLLGSAYLAKRDYPAARAAFEQALALDDALVPALLSLAGIDQLQGDRTSAEQRYRAVLKQDEGNLKALLALGKLAVEQDDKAAAKDFLLQARGSHPDAIKPALLLVELYRQDQDIKRALDLARSVGKAHPRNPGVLKVLARAQIDAGEIDAAITSLRTLTEVAPLSAQAHYQIALLYLRQKNRAATRESLERAIALQADYPSAQLALGRFEIVGKNYAVAQKIAEALQQAHPQAAGGHALEGDILAAQGQNKPALAAYRKAYGLKPSARFAINIFNMQRRAGEGKQASDTLQKWLKDHPGDNATRMVLATHLQQQKRLDEATTEYLAILGQDPDNITALSNLAWLYQKQGSDKGIAYAEQAYELAPQRAEVIDILGWLLVQNGQHQRGLVLLQEAATLAPREAGIRYHMAAALVKVGRTEEARKELERLLGGKDFPAAGEARSLLERLRRP